MDVKMKVGQGEMIQSELGAKRESNEGRGRFDLLPYEAIEALSKWYEAGANKYGDRNWENGISVKDCINRMIRHSIKAGNGWTDEDHLSAVMWNAAAAITMMVRRPDCNDHIWKDGDGVPFTNPEMPTKNYTISIDQNRSTTCEGCVSIKNGKCILVGDICTIDNDGYFTGYKFDNKEHNIPISDEDKLFLVKAIESCGIGDYKTLQDWVNRRVN